MVTKEELDQYIKAYSEGNPLISDEEYDVLLEEYLNRVGEENRPFTRQQQSSNVNDVVGTLPKVYGVTKPMRAGQRIYTDWISQKKIPSTSTICVQPKFDGCSVAIDVLYNQYFTRGDYDNGESVDVTDLFVNTNKPNPAGNDSAKYEAIISRDVFYALELEKQYKRPRDVVSGSLTSRNEEYMKYVTLVPLREYRNGKQYIPADLKDLSCTVNAGDLDSIQNFIDVLLENGAVVQYHNESFECDGVVVSIINEDESIGEEVAIKILNMVEKTKLIKVEYQFGKTGRITPVAIVEPVKFGNVTVDHITLSTMSRIMEMSLKLNDTVSVMYNIVPYLMGSDHDGSILVSASIPTTCPHCGSPLDLSTLKLVQCKNLECPGRILGGIIRYCQKMKMFGVSEKTLTKFFEEGIISSISDLYLILDQYKIEILHGFGKQSADNIVSSIHNASKGIPLDRWLGAFPMNDVSTKTWRILFDNNPVLLSSDVVMSQIRSGDWNGLVDLITNKTETNLYGIGEITLRSMVNGLRFNWNDIMRIFPYIKFKETKHKQIDPTKGRVTLTGTRDAALIQYLEKKGYEVADFSSSKTVALVIPNKTFSSNKVVKSRTLGIPIYTIEEAYGSL